MSLRLYLDHHVPAAIAVGLRRLDLDILTCIEDGTELWDDEPLLVRSTELGRILFTQDDDFLEIAHRWMNENRDFAGLVYGHQLRISIAQAIRDLELIAKIYDSDDVLNRVEYLPL